MVIWNVTKFNQGFLILRATERSLDPVHNFLSDFADKRINAGCPWWRLSYVPSTVGCRKSLFFDHFIYFPFFVQPVKNASQNNLDFWLFVSALHVRFFLSYIELVLF